MRQANEAVFFKRAGPKHSKIANGLGWTLKIFYTMQNAFCDVFGLQGNLDLTPLRTSILAESLIMAGAAPGTFYTNFGFWGREAHKYVLVTADKLKACARADEDHELEYLLGDAEKPPVSEGKVRCQKCLFVSLSPINWGINFSGTFFVIRSALMSRHILNLSEPTIGVLAGATVIAGISTVYSIFTESAGIWNAIDPRRSSIDRTPVRYVVPKYILGILGAMNQNILFNLPMYIMLSDWTDNRVASLLVTCAFGLCSLVQTFYFQSGVILENTELMQKIEGLVNNLGKGSRYTILTLVGITQTLVSFTLSAFTTREIYRDVFVGRYGLAMSEQLINGLSYSQAVIATIGDMFSEYAETCAQLLAPDADVQANEYELGELDDSVCSDDTDSMMARL